MDMAKIETIIPHVGVDHVTFGMAPAEVAKIRGAPDTESLNFLKERIEYRNGVSTIYSTENKLVEIGSARTCVNVRINGVFILKNDGRLPWAVTLTAQGKINIQALV